RVRSWCFDWRDPRTTPVRRLSGGMGGSSPHPSEAREIIRADAIRVRSWCFDWRDPRTTPVRRLSGGMGGRPPHPSEAREIIRADAIRVRSRCFDGGPADHAGTPTLVGVVPPIRAERGNHSPFMQSG